MLAFSGMHEIKLRLAGCFQLFRVTEQMKGRGMFLLGVEPQTREGGVIIKRPDMRKHQLSSCGSNL